MSKEEIKQEIARTLDQFSEKALQDLLSFLKQFHDQPSVSLFSGDHFKKLLTEDKELLERLAQ
jgi:type III secretory pathway component EscR